MNAIGFIKFADLNIMLYKDCEDPLFKARDIVRALKYKEPAYRLMECCEVDEVEYINNEIYFTERGLYNILAKSNTPTGRRWRRIVFDQLIEMRKSRGMTVSEQFDEWDSNDIYYDEKTSTLMKSVIVEGGDVMQVAVGE